VDADERSDALDQSRHAVAHGVLDKDIKIARNDGEAGFSEITAIAESPVDAKVLWVGTDDGTCRSPPTAARRGAS